jgi:hypothetical protein
MTYSDIPEGFSIEEDQFSDIPEGFKVVKRDYALSEIPGEAMSNLGRNAGEVGSALWEAAKHPVETAKNIGKLGVGMAQEFIPGQQDYETSHADPFYSRIFEDYGSIEGAKRTLAEKPVQAFLDATMVLPGGPIGAATKGVSAVAKVPSKVAKYGLGESTGIGPRAVGEAYQSGKSGGSRAADFRENMRGVADPEDVVTQARGAVGELRRERASEYTKGMQGVRADQTVLNFDEVNKALHTVAGVKRFKGVSINEKTATVSKEIMDKVGEWRSLNPKEYHTPEGLDALKQAIGDIRDSTQYGTPARRVADAAYHGVRNQIVKQAPEYANTMKAYEKASSAIDEVTKTLSLGKGATADTALRKLQSVLRNNAFTNWSARAKLAELVEKKVPTLMAQLSGQAANTWTPRGLPAKLLQGGAGITGLGAMVMVSPLAIIPMIAGAFASSPRIVAETAHGAGRAVGTVQKAGAKVPARGTAIVSREGGLQQAERVLSPEVLEHMKKVAPRQIDAWLKDRGPETSRALAEAIATAVKRPELVERIAAELGAQ